MSYDRYDMVITDSKTRQKLAKKDVDIVLLATCRGKHLLATNVA